MNPAARVLAWAAGIALLVAGLAGVWLAAFGLIVSAQAPDALVIDGDPCCGHPDDWGEVAMGVGWSVLAALVAGLLWGGGAALIAYASGSRVRPRRLALVPAATTAVAAVAAAALVVPALGDGVERPDCEEFRFDRAAWAREGTPHRRMALGLATCRTLHGFSETQVRNLLGPPEGGSTDIHAWRNLTVEFDRGRVSGAEAYVDDDVYAD